MTESMTDLLYDILESEACEKYYINNAEKPAFLVLSKWNPLSHGKFELYMNRVARLGEFKTKKELIAKLLQVMSTANKPKKFYKVDKFGRKRREKVLFAVADGKGNLREALK